MAVLIIIVFFPHCTMSPHTKSDPSTHSWVAMTTFRKGMVLDQHPTVGVGFKPASLTTDLVLLPQASLCKIAVITEEASLCLHDLTCRSLTFSSTWPQHTHTHSVSVVFTQVSRAAGTIWPITKQGRPTTCRTHTCNQITHTHKQGDEHEHKNKPVELRSLQQKVLIILNHFWSANCC